MKKRKSKGRLTTLLLLVILMGGLALLLYPLLSDYWNSLTQTQAILYYAEQVAGMDAEMYDAIWNGALDYNERLSQSGMLWHMNDAERAEYEAALNVDGKGNMGYIDIPKINVSLPLYHGTDDVVLQSSIGHIEGTSLPVGSRHPEEDVTVSEFGSHCVLSGHRGLPSAKLFSELDKLVEGDRFILTVLDQTMTYEVDDISVVEPNDMSGLTIEPGKEYVTLVTCTPYGINTHRLLVRGRRIENDRRVDVRIIADGMRIAPMYVAPFIAVPIAVLLIIWMMIVTSGARKRRRRS